uniref:GST C-terminal domain-containing protein n=1 Tax=Panagrolaimus sp. JU765 TaxID=591449 RepID=A0AC34RBE2_9BILA
MSKDDKTEYFKTKTRQALDHFASLYEKFLVENGGTPLILDNITWVDIFAAEFFTRFAEYGENDALEAYPHIQQLVDRIHNLPEIKQHISKRPKTQF